MVYFQPFILFTLLNPYRHHLYAPTITPPFCRLYMGCFSIYHYSTYKKSTASSTTMRCSCYPANQQLTIPHRPNARSACAHANLPGLQALTILVLYICPKITNHSNFLLIFSQSNTQDPQKSSLYGTLSIKKGAALCCSFQRSIFTSQNIAMTAPS